MVRITRLSVALSAAAAVFLVPFPSHADVGDPCTFPFDPACSSEMVLCVAESEDATTGICVDYSDVLLEDCSPDVPLTEEEIAAGIECMAVGDGWMKVDMSAYRAAGDFGGEDVTLESDTSWWGTMINIGTLTVPEGVTLSTFPGQKLEIHAESIVVDGTISLDGGGYPGVEGYSNVGRNGNGPGAGGMGGSMVTGGGGGGHGGVGGRGGGAGENGGVACCSMEDALLDMGSSGGSGGGIASESPGGASGAGGGLLLLHAGSILVNGLISANGDGGRLGLSVGSGSGGGGGAGGGIFLWAESIGGSGALSAAGGGGGSYVSMDGTFGGGGGGGGGCIKLFYVTLEGEMTISAAGGELGQSALRPGTAGQEGTILHDGLPVVQADDPAAELTGDGLIDYVLSDGDEEVCGLAVTFSTDGETFLPATDSGAGDGKTSLASSAAGISHVFGWSSSADLPGYSGEAMLDLCPSDRFVTGICDRVVVQVRNGAGETAEVFPDADAFPEAADEAGEDASAGDALELDAAVDAGGENGDGKGGCGCAVAG